MIFQEVELTRDLLNAGLFNGTFVLPVVEYRNRDRHAKRCVEIGFHLFRIARLRTRQMTVAHAARQTDRWHISRPRNLGGELALLNRCQALLDFRPLVKRRGIDAVFCRNRRENALIPHLNIRDVNVSVVVDFQQLLELRLVVLNLRFDIHHVIPPTAHLRSQLRQVGLGHLFFLDHLFATGIHD